MSFGLERYNEKDFRYLKLLSKKYSNGNPTTNWNFFKLKFGWKNLGNARKNWLQINGMEARSMEGDNNYLPKGHDKVDDIFDELCYTSTE